MRSGDASRALTGAITLSCKLDSPTVSTAAMVSIERTRRSSSAEGAIGGNATTLSVDCATSVPLAVNNEMFAMPACSRSDPSSARASDGSRAAIDAAIASVLRVNSFSGWLSAVRPSCKPVSSALSMRVSK